METNLTTPQVLTGNQEESIASEQEYRQIGFGRPPLKVEDLPTPEKVFGVRRVGLEELILFILGPSLIALGISVGSGEWMLGPLNIGQFGFRGLGWVILLSTILQVFYNVELARFTVATGETPVAAFSRVPPGPFIWAPLAILCFYMAFILGGWTTSAGTALFALITGRMYQPEELEFVRWIGIGLLAFSLLFMAFGRKVERTMELAMGLLLVFAMVSLVIVTLVVVPSSYLGDALASLILVERPPAGADPSVLGGMAGFAALASGLNFMFIGYYRDKGYGMGAKTGYISGLFGGRRVAIEPVGRTFPETKANAALWQRWWRYLLLDQWGIYFIGALIGMLAPSLLVGFLADLPSSIPPTQTSIFLYAALRLGNLYGPVLFSWALLVGFLLLYTTQIVILELLARTVTETVTSIYPQIRARAKRRPEESYRPLELDPRRLYYALMVLLVVAIGVIIHLGSLPTEIILLSANLSNFAALIFPLAMIYLNRQLPRPAKITWWSYVVLIANTLFFGFFFLNFIVTTITGSPLITF